MSRPTTIPWLRLTAEAAAIVLSILLAFGIDAAWGQRETNELRTRALEAVMFDMEANNQELEQWVGVNSRILLNTGLLLDELEAAGSGRDLTVPDTLLAAALLIPTYDPVRSSVEAVTAIGRVPLVQDDSIRAALGAWLRALDDMSEDQVEVRNIESRQIAPTLARQVNLRPIYADLLAWALEEQPAALLSSSSELTVETELIGLLAHRQFRVGLVQGLMETLLDFQRDIARMIREQLEA